MPRKKLNNPDELLSRPIVVRVNEATYARLEKIQKESDCQSIGEVVRKILSNQRIKCFYRDISLNAPMEEMALIRKEIKAIGININQQTHKFHIAEAPTERAFHHIKTTETYRRLEPKIDRLLILISKLAQRWLQRS
ncbi:mobilization protein [Parapedobacter sp. DT-150]|uniref:mobilization protein n=1 Tax=Parapedobacter sp. DT-150 TaxID=3396162 RepID=UPI003F194275